LQQNGKTPFSAVTEAGIDYHYANRLRCLMSVEDLLADVFATLDDAGVTENTYVFMSSDHGYKLGQYNTPFEKSSMYDTDVHVPFVVTGPGVPAGKTSSALVSLMDVGATMLELAGVTASGERISDGRSLVALLDGSIPALWRTEVLVEFFGASASWATVCSGMVVYDPPGCSTPVPSAAAAYMIEGPQNTFSMLRRLSADGAQNYVYSEARPMGAAHASASTNWTELYDLNADPDQTNNLAQSMSARQLAPYKRALWAIAHCSGAECP
jgi:hypothetical protein